MIHELREWFFCDDGQPLEHGFRVRWLPPFKDEPGALRVSPGHGPDGPWLPVSVSDFLQVAAAISADLEGGEKAAR